MLEGLRGEYSIAQLCRREGIAQGLYYTWSKDFMEAGKKRLSGDTARQATTSEITLDLIAANGFDACLDWEFDCAPKPMRTKNGTITMVPNLNELDDRKLLIERKHSEQEWAEQLIEAAAYSKTISTKNSPQSFAITLTPYISGLPFRIRCVRDTLQQLKEMVDFKTVQSIL